MSESQGVAEEAQLSFTVVVCTRDRPERLEQCLDALARLRYSRFEVLVVDNAPHTEQARNVAEGHQARYVLEPVAGLSRARNRGIAVCNTDVIAFTDDDAVPEPDWLSLIAAEFQDPLVAAVAGRTLATDPTTENELLGSRIDNHDFGPDKQIIDSLSPCWFELANFGGIGNGMNVAFRRGPWLFFSEELGRGTSIGGWEEHYAFFSLVDHGYRVVYTPHAIVRHPYPQGVEELRRRLLADASGACAYMIFLLVGERRYRWRVLRYALQSLSGKQRPWRRTQADSAAKALVVPLWRLRLEYLWGPFLYLRSRFQQWIKTGLCRREASGV